MTKENILITGGTGFIGSHITEKFLTDESYSIVAIVRRKKNYKNVEELKNKGAILAEGNFYDINFVEKIFKEFQIQHVIHIAALRGGGVSTKDDYYKVNVMGTETLLKASLKNGIKRFIFCSSVGVFGTIPKELPASLNTELNGDNEYHNSKILAEEKVQKFINMGLDAYIVRPTITYGKEDDGFPLTLVKMVRRKMLLLPFRDNKIHLLDVNKLVDVFVRVLIADSLKHRVFIVSDKEPILLRELTNIIYFYYHNKNYPPFLKLPNFLFNSLLFFFRVLNNEKWVTRIQLIFQNWYYDVEKIDCPVGFESSNTKEEFLKFLQTLA